MGEILAWLLIMSGVAVGIAVGNSLSTLIQMKMITGKKFMKRLVKRSTKLALGQMDSVFKSLKENLDEIQESE